MVTQHSWTQPTTPHSCLEAFEEHCSVTCWDLTLVCVSLFPRPKLFSFLLFICLPYWKQWEAEGQPETRVDTCSRCHVIYNVAVLDSSNSSNSLLQCSWELCHSIPPSHFTSGVTCSWFLPQVIAVSMLRRRNVSMALCCVHGPLERNCACWQDNRMTLSTSALLVSVLQLVGHVTLLHVMWSGPQSHVTSMSCDRALKVMWLQCHVIWPLRPCDFIQCHVIWPLKSCNFIQCHVIWPLRSCDFTVSGVLGT